MLLDVRLFTVKEYHCMAEAGILAPDERVELLAGKIIKMAAKGTPHSAATTPTEKLLENRLGKQVLVRVQEPVRLNDLSEPEPDIAVLIPDPLYYEDHHPTPSEVYLIIEVADTSRERDLNFKAGIYAQSGIADYIMSGRLPLIKIERASPCHRSPKSFLTMGIRCKRSPTPRLSRTQLKWLSK